MSNPLGSPWVTGALALVAVGVVVYQFKPHTNGSQSPASVPPPPAVNAPVSQAISSKPASGTVQTPPPKMVVPTNAAIDYGYVQSHFAEWLDAPQRDPFLILAPG